MKKTICIFLIIFSLAMCCDTVCLASRSESLIDENYENSDAGVSLDTLAGWRTIADSNNFNSIFEARETAIDTDGNTYIRIASDAGNHYAGATTLIEKDIPDKGEGVYEISFRFNPDELQASIYDCFSLYAYVKGETTPTIKRLILFAATDKIQTQFPKWDSGYYAEYYSVAGYLTANTWYDVKYVVNTVANKATVSYKKSSDSEWIVYQDETIASVDGLSYLRLRPGWKSADSSMSFDDIEVVYSPAPVETVVSPVKEVLANESYDTLSSEAIPVQALDGWSREDGRYVFGIETASDNTSGKLMRIKPRKKGYNGEHCSYIRSVPDRGEGVYEFCYRLNFEDIYSNFYDIFSLYAYPENSSDNTPKCILSFSLYGTDKRGLVQYATSFSLNSYKENIMPSTFGKDTWYDFYYKLDTVSNKVTFSYRKASDTSWAKTYTGTIPAVSAPAYLKLRPGYRLETDDTDHSKALAGTYSFDDLLITYDSYVDVVSTYPTQDAENIGVRDTEVKLTFNVPMDEGSLTPYSILVYKGDSSEPLAVNEYTVEASANKFGNTVATVRFAKPLSYGTAYRVEVPADSVYTKDFIRPKEDFILEFTTKPLPAIRFTFFDENNKPVTNLADVAGKIIYIRMNIAD